MFLSWAYLLIVAGETLMFLKSKIEIRALTCYPYKAGGVICTSLPLKCLGVSQRMPLTITCAVYCLQIFAYVKRKKNDQINVTTSCTELLYYLRYKNRDISSIGHFHDLVTSYRINNAGTQVTQWNFQTKGTRTSSARLSLACRTGVFFFANFFANRGNSAAKARRARSMFRARGESAKRLTPAMMFSRTSPRSRLAFRARSLDFFKTKISPERKY